MIGNIRGKGARSARNLSKLEVPSKGQKIVKASSDHPDIPVPSPSVVNTGEILIPQRPTAVDWTFVDWYKDDKGNVVFNREGEIILGNTDLWGKWKEGGPTPPPPADKIKVQFQWGGGSPPDPSNIRIDLLMGDQKPNVGGDWLPQTPIFVQYGAKKTIPEGNSTSNWLFDGWYYDSDGVHRPYNSNENLFEDITLYGKWVADSGADVVITFELGSTNTPASEVLPTPKIVAKNTTINPRSYPPSNVPGNWTWDGWFRDYDLRKPFDGLVGDTNFTLYAGFTEAVNTVDVTYEYYDGDGNPGDGYPNTSGGLLPVEVYRVGDTYIVPEQPDVAGWDRIGFYLYEPDRQV